MIEIITESIDLITPSSRLGFLLIIHSTVLSVFGLLVSGHLSERHATRASIVCVSVLTALIALPLMLSSTMGKAVSGLTIQLESTEPSKAQRIVTLADRGSADAALSPFTDQEVEFDDEARLSAKVAAQPSSETTQHASDLARSNSDSSPLGFASFLTANQNSITRFSFVVYILGIVCQLVALAIAHQRIRRAALASSSLGNDPRWQPLINECRRKLGVKADVQLRRSLSVAQPCLFGWKDPKILVPSESTSWNETQRQHVLMHELAHLRRNDVVKGWLANLARMFYWPNPVVHRLVNHFTRVREWATDDVAVAHGCDRLTYAETLLHIVRKSSSSQIAISMGRYSVLKPRIKRLSDHFTSTTTASPRFQLTCHLSVLGVATTLVLFAGTVAESQPPTTVSDTSSDRTAESRIDTDAARAETSASKFIGSAAYLVPSVTNREAWMTIQPDGKSALVLRKGHWAKAADVDLASGQVTDLDWPNHSTENWFVRSAAFSPDRSKLAVVISDMPITNAKIAVYDTHTRQSVSELKLVEDLGLVHEVLFVSNNGDELIFSGVSLTRWIPNNQSIERADLSSVVSLTRLENSQFVISNNRREVAILGKDLKPRVSRRVSTSSRGGGLQWLGEHGSSGNLLLVNQQQNATCFLLDRDALTEIDSVRLSGYARNVAQIDDQLIVSSDSERTNDDDGSTTISWIKVAKNGRLLQMGHEMKIPGSVTAVSTFPSGDRLALMNDRRIEVRDAGTGALLSEIPSRLSGPAEELTVIRSKGPDEELLLTTSRTFQDLTEVFRVPLNNGEPLPEKPIKSFRFRLVRQAWDDEKAVLSRYARRGREIATQVLIVDARTPESAQPLPLPDNSPSVLPQHIAFHSSRESNELRLLGGNGKLYTIDTNSWRLDDHVTFSIRDLRANFRRMTRGDADPFGDVDKPNELSKRLDLASWRVRPGKRMVNLLSQNTLTAISADESAAATIALQGSSIERRASNFCWARDQTRFLTIEPSEPSGGVSGYETSSLMRCWDPSTGRLIWEQPEIPVRSWRMFVDRSETRIAVTGGNRDGQGWLLTYSLVNGRQIDCIPVDRLIPNGGLAWSLDDSHVYVARNDSTIARIPVPNTD